MDLSLDIMLKLYSKTVSYNFGFGNFGFLYFWILLMSLAIL